ncbi:RES family NAD+ phosphorylase [Streptosporangium sp. NPDC023615]|uniref:RES family NAD+ phosphorylase n=1 Tax=Streptosporangium sp. NPDC023615 TaxID=3154794 RepID=UPI0034277EDA
MPLAPPPARHHATPHLRELPAGTRLWRVHDRRFKATDFNPRPADANFGGGRFDGTGNDPYPYYYAGLEAETALAEALLRDIPFDDRGVRLVRRAKVRGRRASVVITTEDLVLVDLCSGEALAAVAQDSWLVHADPVDYHATRRWGSWIRERAPAAHGLIWPSKREGGQPALVLFGDRCSPASLIADPFAGTDLDDREGAAWLNGHLARYRACVLMPRRPG